MVEKPELRVVHVQRLEVAVSAALAGGDIHFHLIHGDPPSIIWRDSHRPRVHHVVVAVWHDGQGWLDLVEATFRKTLAKRVAQQRKKKAN